VFDEPLQVGGAVVEPAAEVPNRARQPWPLTSASDAVGELIRLVGTLGVADWTYVPAAVGSNALDLRSVAGTEPVPIVLPDGQAVGTVRCPAEPTGDPRDTVLRALLQSVVLLVAMERRGYMAVDRASLYERESRFDALTGLPNRRLWDEGMAQEQARCNRHDLRALVAVIDLDDLKATNDDHGHLAGDVLLRVTGQALRRAVRDTDLVARLGGDEFAVLAVEFEEGDPERFARRVHDALFADGVSASVGVALAEPGRPLAVAFDEADHTMYAAKRSRKGEAARS
jgi:diguanylate cyclase